ncbi:CMGC/DYRK/DYRK1 protein kinase [Salpingoeca rosetta]|uniref:dual-specificity kinase n=1 Tax=Salpingoeca rosetta (strain ATCC 50818 / BSB-021) TaxID=946362 RepID=F2U8F0_SALR5|nr:CMGC/DYRK/DYRK1 protein kinase [Salpingoeca rosetta]EGD72658.1 CMGC/DYRK/DYRK1 protein kinase [Salpingoeca rosetta]|eukprot:XP_004994481.1 CMGC/DYRK/DYRK1 protein kinase [Salpingoeca rosetta]
MPPPKYKPRPERAQAPLVKLTASLIDTYRHINKVYYEQKNAQKKGKKNNGYDNEHCDYILKEGEVWLDRYVIHGLLGKGSFGQVTQARDRELSRDVAVKIIKNKTAFRRQAQIEIDLLEKIRDADPDDEHHLVRMISTFEHRNHLCIVFELLSFNLYDLIRNTNFRGVSLNLIRKFSRQIVDALDFLASERLSIIHCDLKPENILLKSPKRTAIKIVDFGSSCHIGKTMYPYIQSRFYRSPEVLLGLPYDQAIDMWSFGCIMYELHTGDPIFNGSSQRDQVHKIAELLGVPPVHMLEKGRSVGNYFSKLPSGQYELIRSTKRSYMAPGTRRLAHSLGSKTGGPKGRRLGEMGHSPSDYHMFEDLLLKCLHYDPRKRASPAEAAVHRFLVSGPPSSSSTAASSSKRSSHAAGDQSSSSSSSKHQHRLRFNMPNSSRHKPAKHAAGRASV